MKSKLRKARRVMNPQAGAGKLAGQASSAWKWIVLGVAAAVVFASSFAVFEFVLPGRIPQELVGEWRVVGGDLSGMTLEFKRSGAMKGRAVVNGIEREMEGTAELTGKSLSTTTTNPFTNRRETG